MLRKMGFQVRSAATALNTGGNEYLAADDRRRCEEFHALLADPEVDALLAMRGGYGCLRIAALIDYDLVRASRKCIIGFSDISVLLNAVNSRSGLVSIHGPVLTTLARTDRAGIAALESMLRQGPPPVIAATGAVVLRPGTGRGILRGGNLATLTHLLGTPWEIEWKDALLLLEDTGEPMYKIDRMLTQLQYSGRLNRLAGILLGEFDPGDGGAADTGLQEQVWRRVLEVTTDRSCPVWGNFPAGHREMNLPLPLGHAMIMDSGSLSLSLLKK